MTRHRLRVVRALVRDLEAERDFQPEPGVLTDDADEIRGDPSIGLVAEVMGGIEPAGSYVLELLDAGKSVVTANKQLVARRGAELFAAAATAGVQLRFEASVCAAIPVIKVLRESLISTNVHRVLGIVNGTTNFLLTEMESGATFASLSTKACAPVTCAARRGESSRPAPTLTVCWMIAGAWMLKSARVFCSGFVLY